MRLANFCFLSGVLLLAAIGCQEGSSLKTANVSGTVTLDGQPVDGATVTFLPKGDPASGHTATGMTNAEGRYELQTFESASKPVKGAVPGDYDVIVNKYEVAQQGMSEANARPMAGKSEADVKSEQSQAMSGAMSSEKRQGASGAASKDRAAVAAGDQAPKMTLPKKYASATDSGLSATVSVDQKSPIDFKLTSQ